MMRVSPFLYSAVQYGIYRVEGKSLLRETTSLCAQRVFITTRVSFESKQKDLHDSMNTRVAGGAGSPDWWKRYAEASIPEEDDPDYAEWEKSLNEVASVIFRTSQGLTPKEMKN